LWKHRFDCPRKALETINNGNQDIGDTPVPELVHDAQPVLCPFGRFDPDAEDLLRPIGQNAKCDLDRLVANKAFIAVLHPDRIEEYQRITIIERAAPPFGDRIHLALAAPAEGSSQARRVALYSLERRAGVRASQLHPNRQSPWPTKPYTPIETRIYTTAAEATCLPEKNLFAIVFIRSP